MSLKTIDKIREWLHEGDNGTNNQMIIGMNLADPHVKFPIYISKDPGYIDKNAEETEKLGYQNMELYSYSEDLEQQLMDSPFNHSCPSTDRFSEVKEFPILDGIESTFPLPDDVENKNFFLEKKSALQTYIITKVVQAEPQDCPEGTYNSKAGDPGYKIVSEDGHVSWRSKETFERAYKELEGLTFGLAIEALRKGLKVRLPHWEEGVYLIMYSFMKNEDSKDPYEVITIVGHAGRAQWMPDTQDDILSEKWKIID